MKKQVIDAEKAVSRLFLCGILCSVLIMSSVGTAKSLYLLGNSDDIHKDTLWVYNILPGGKISFEKTATIRDGGNSAPNGLTMDPNSNTLFSTYSGWSDAGTTDLDTLAFRGFVYLVPWDMHAGGITYDAARSRVYVTDDQQRNRVVLYNWKPEVNGLHNIDIAGTTVPTERLVAGAITFGPESRRVYVASLGEGIEILETAEERKDWKTVGFLESGHEIHTLSVDARNQYLYAGARTEKGGFLTQYKLIAGTMVQKQITDPTQRVLSLSVDTASTLVYALIGNVRIPNRKIRVYDRALNILQEVVVMGDPRRIHVPGTPLSYNPLNTTIQPVAGTVEKAGQQVAVPGAEIEYQICMNNANLYAITNIVVTNELPAELQFVRAENLGSATGEFDAATGTYSYHNPTLQHESSQCFSIVTRLKEDVPVGTVIVNSVAVDSNETDLSFASADVTVEAHALALEKSLVMDPNYLVVGDVVYVDPGATLTYQVCLDNLNGHSAAHNVLVIDELPDDVEFVSAEQMGVPSHYDANSHSLSWALDSVEPNYLDCSEITVRVKDDVPPGTVITNKVRLDSEAATATDSADVVVRHAALSVNKTIADSRDYSPVTNQVVRGGDLTYLIEVSNLNPLYSVENVVVIDAVPPGLQFIGSVGDANGMYDPASRTVTLSQPVLAPLQEIRVELTFTVADDLPGGTVLTNSVMAMADGTPASSASVDVTVESHALVLEKNVVMDPNYLVVGDVIYVDPGATLTYQICVDNLSGHRAANNVVVIDELPEDVEFVSAEPLGVTSQYDANSHSFSWTLDSVEPNHLDCFEITVRVKDDVSPGKLITNKVTLGSETATVTTGADVVVKHTALFINKAIADSGDYSPATNQVVAGGVLTYLIDVNNPNPLNSAENVVLIDSAPAGLQFIGSVGDANGVYDPTSGTFTLSRPALGPSEGIHLELTFRVADDVPDGSVLTNSVVAMANGAPASSDSVSVGVVVPVVPPVSATLDLYYTSPLLRQDQADDIMAVLKLPDPIEIEDIDVTQPLTMTPGPALAHHIDAVQGIPTVYYMYIGFNGILNVKGFFDRQTVLDALSPGQESVTLTVTGLLKTGQSFQGQTTVPVN